MQAPVVLFVYNRADHTKQVIEALSHNDGATDTEVFIYSDAAADETEECNVRKVRQYLEEIRNQTWFKKISIIPAEQNKGLEESIIEGVTNIMSRYGRAIVLEDDIVTAPDFLNFMNQALDYYENDDKIWSISGYTINSNRVRKGKRDVYLAYRAECWGWASWQNRWDKVDWAVSDYADFEHNKKQQKAFNKGGRDLSGLLKLQMEGKIRSWAVRWCYQQFKENMFTVFPKHSKIYNIGLDGSGTNCSKQDVEWDRFLKESKWDFVYDISDTLVSDEFRKLYYYSYIRQTVGKIWYLFTEYEYCIIYRNNESEEYRIIKPSFKEWYADPIPFIWKGGQYIFVEGYDKIRCCGSISVFSLGKDGNVTTPQKVISEGFHLSFPHIFQYHNNVYMIPECSEVEQIRIYKMRDSISEWELHFAFDIREKVVDIVTYQLNEELLLIGSCIDDEHPNQAAMVCYELKNLDDVKSIEMQKCWCENNFSYAVRNAGAFIKKGDEIYRVIQHSTKTVYGKFVSLKKVCKLDKNGYEEVYAQKYDISKLKVKFPAFIYRVWGMHTYGMCGTLEVADVLVQRFSIGGLFMKVLRRLCRQCSC